MKQIIIIIAALVLVGCGPPPPDISIHDAARDGNIEAVKQDLAAGTDVNANDFLNLTPLRCAAVWAHREIVKLLINNGADVDTKEISGSTPLHQAAFKGRKEVVGLLIAKGADVNAISVAGRTPLDEAQYLFLGYEEEMIVNKKVTADLLRKHGAKTGEELENEGN